MPGKGGGTPKEASSVSFYCARHNFAFGHIHFHVIGSEKVGRREKENLRGGWDISIA
jgi:hypothetical protein